MPETTKPALERGPRETHDRAGRLINPEIKASPGHPQAALYEASPLKRRRATNDEMARRAAFLIAYAEQHGPVTVRGLYYQAEVRGIPGIDKTDRSYAKVQRQVLNLRRSGRLDYRAIADATRWMRKPASYDGIADALQATARLYRKALWRDAESYVEVWCEKDALAGVIYPVTAAYDVALMVARGFSSETFCYEAIEQRGADRRPFRVYYLGDFDRSGRDAASSLREKLTRFAREKRLPVIFELLAVTPEQIERLGLPTRPHKRTSSPDRKWPAPFACELDAIDPEYLREIVDAAIQRHLPARQFEILKAAEASERNLIAAFVNSIEGGAP